MADAKYTTFKNKVAGIPSYVDSSIAILNLHKSNLQSIKESLSTTYFQGNAQIATNEKMSLLINSSSISGSIYNVSQKLEKLSATKSLINSYNAEYNRYIYNESKASSTYNSYESIGKQRYLAYYSNGKPKYNKDGTRAYEWRYPPSKYQTYNTYLSYYKACNNNKSNLNQYIIQIENILNS